MNKITVKSGEPIGPLGPSEKNKQWQRELLMERLRTHSSQHKTFQELSRSMRMSMLEKRYALDAVEKSNLQKCLDSMQHCIKVTTRQGLVERLESLSRQLGLKFMEDTSGLFISSDMFYLEIILDSDGTLSDVKVHHECKIEQQSCSELVTCLLKGDFADFTVQLEGLSSIYQLNAEPKVKSKAFVALQAMETDLHNLFTMQNFHKDIQALLMDSSVGIVQKRRGGHSMKLVYFVPPYDLLNLETKSMHSLNLDLISSKNIGMSVAVNLEASSANKLQILPTVTFNKDMQGESIPIYSPMTPMNSTLLPATFVLRLNTPLPVCKSLMNTLIHWNDSNANEGKLVSIMDLIVQTASGREIKNCSKGLFVNLPDQNHLYYFSENKSMKGTVVTNIPFTEPSQVPKILNILRKQALFYTLLASCVRPICKMCDLETTTILEVNAISITKISVALEHPFEESMASVEFDLSDGKNISCHIYSMMNNYDLIALKLSKIVQKSLSIPITVRALLKFWEQERLKGYHRNMENGNFNLPLGPNDPNGRNDFREMKAKNERIGGPGVSFNSGGRQFFHTSGVMMSSNEGFSSGNSLSMFETSVDNRMQNQFGMKSNHEMDFQDVSSAVTGFSGEDFYKSPKSKADTFCHNFSETSDSSSLGTSTSTSDSGVTAQGFQKVFNKDAIGGSSSNISDKSGSDKRSQSKEAKNNKSFSLNSSKAVPVMSTKELTSVLTGMGLEKRPGIEIVPVKSSSSQNFQTSITITPINVSKSEKKHSSSKKSEDKSKSDKKRKRRKEDSPMGPPEKLISKQDSLSRVLNATLKKDLLMSPNRKPSSSPSMVSNSSRPSPKYSPAYSPKGQSISPKHASSGSSGKPSMLTLKSATNSVSPKNDKINQKMQARDRDKDKERIMKNLSSTSPKTKSSLKLKQIDLSPAFLHHLESSGNEDGSRIARGNFAVGESISPNSLLGSNATNSLVQSKIRKGSLSAVIDKLKLAQNTGDEIPNMSTQKLEGDVYTGGMSRDKLGGDGSDKLQQSIYNSNYKMSGQGSSPAFSSEYMIKPSLDGMKITINKTRAKETQKMLSPPINASSVKFPPPIASGSPKRHNGPKPGVLGGPASKKNVMASLLKSTPLSSGSQAKGFQRTNSAGNLTTKGPFGSSDLYKKDKTAKSKGASSDKSASSRPDPMDVMKILRLNSPNNSMDGFMKTLNTKFQIPKLSARTSDDSKKDGNPAQNSGSTGNAGNSSTSSATSTSTTSPSTATTTTTTNTNISLNPESSKVGPEKIQYSIGKASTSEGSSQQPGMYSAFGKISPFFPSTSPKFGHDGGTLSREVSQLSKSSSSDAILSALQKDYTIKPHSVSTPSTPMHVTSPFTSPVGAILNSSPAYRPSPSASPNVQGGSVMGSSGSAGNNGSHSDDNSTMRPPSAPCVVDIIKTNETDLTLTKSDNKFIPVDQRSTNTSSTTATGVAKKANATSHTVPHKMALPQSPSVSIHIVKSPVPSPLMLLPSPHSNSPCITDEELIDESLVGIKGK